MTAQEILAKVIANTTELAHTNPVEFTEEDGNVILPIFWSEDNKGNINFDIDSITYAFNELIAGLEQHNNESEFDFDNF